MEQVGVAAFDVDGTLTTRDCVVPYLRSTRGTPSFVARLAFRPGALAAALLARDRDRMKAVGAVAGLRGVREERLVEAAELLVSRVMRSRLRPEMVERLRWHVDQKHRVVLVSASFEVYLDLLGRELGTDAVLGTALEIVDGRCTGRLAGPNCRGAEKVRRLHEWLDGAVGGRDRAEVWAYGDSAGDRELLADADHAVWVTDRLGALSAQ